MEIDIWFMEDPDGPSGMFIGVGVGIGIGFGIGLRFGFI